MPSSHENNSENPTPSPHWLRWIGLALFALTLIVIYQAVLKPWRIRHWDWKVTSASAEQDWEAVLRFAPRGLDWNSENLTLLWLQTRASIGNDFSDAGDLPLPRFDPEMHPQGLLAAAEVYQGIGDWETTAPILPLLADTLPRDPRTILLYARQALEEERTEKALDWARALVATVPDDASTQLLAARTRLLEQDLFASLEALAHLFAAAEDPGSDGANAISLLGALFNRMVLSPTERTRLADLIEAHPLSQPRERLLAALIRIQDDPENREEVIARMIGMLRTSEPVVLSQWLQGLGEYERSLEILQTARTDDAVESREATQMQLGAYLSLGKDEEALDFLARFEGEIGSGDSEFIRFVLMVREGNRTPGELRDQARKTFAAISGSNNPRSLLVFSRICANVGLIDEAIEAIDSIDLDAVPPAVRPQIVFGRLNYLIVAKQTAEAFSYGMQNIELVQQQPLMLNNVTYIGLLLGKDVSAQLELLRKFIAGNSDLNILSGTLAFSSLIAGDIEEAELLHAKVPEEFRNSNSASLLLGASIDHENGNPMAASTKLERIDPQQLLPEENARFEELNATLREKS